MHIHPGKVSDGLTFSWSLFIITVVSVYHYDDANQNCKRWKYFLVFFCLKYFILFANYFFVYAG